MLHAGIGETHVNGLLSSLDSPLACHKTLKKSEREIGHVREVEAKSSCRRNLENEVKQAARKESNKQSTSAESTSSPRQKLAAADES